MARGGSRTQRERETAPDPARISQHGVAAIIAGGTLMAFDEVGIRSCR
jgi:hypothetical protein